MTDLLLVEDDPAIVSSLSDFLTQEGFTVTAASGQAAASRILETRRFHLALLDVTLGDGSGFSLCASIKAQYHIPVIFLTALADESSTVALTQGHSGDIWIRKAPACTMGDLAQALLLLLGRSAPITILGPRHGEKLAETLLTAEESARALDLGTCFRIPMDARDLHYGLSPALLLPGGQAFTSDGAARLSIAQIQERLLQLPEVQALLPKEDNP